MKVVWPPGQPQPQAQAKRLRTLRRVAVAVLALAAVQPAAAQQPSGTPPAGMATSGDHQKLQAELAAARADINAAQKKLDLALTAQRQADGRAAAAAAEKIGARPGG